MGTLVAEGKPTKNFDGRTYVMERGIVADVGLVHAWQGDISGNLVYRATARNFNPLCAESGLVTIAQCEEILPLGGIEPAHVTTPGVHVDHIVAADDREKPIEQRTTRPRATVGKEI